MGKVKLFLWLTEPHAMKGYWAVLTSALDGGEWSASQSGCFTSRERAPSTRWIGGRVGPRAVLDAVVKRKISGLRRESNSRTPIVQPIASEVPYREQIQCGDDFSSCCPLDPVSAVVLVF